ncbi:unnamed protein product [Urochloa humidicola]
MEDKVFLSTVSALVLLFILSKLKSLLLTKQPKLNLPPGPWTLPVIGSIHHLVSSANLHRAMSRLAQKHGPLMMLRLGEVPAVVATSPEAAMEIMKTHDITFADRYMNATAAALTFDGNNMGLAPYGERWRQLRKICVLELLSATQVQSFRHIREDEVALFMQDLAVSAGTGAAVNLTKMISMFINDTFVRESIGRRCEYRDDYLDALDTAMRLTSGLAIADLFPSSRLMQALSAAPRKILVCRKRIERILENMIQETKEAGMGGEGFLDILLRLQKDTPMLLTKETIVAVLSDMFIAGSDSSSTTLTWCMTELVLNPSVMAKAQAEVREAFKGKTIITEDGLEGLSYLKLVIKETLRLHTPGPLLVPRTCRETCKVMGYDIPKGTVVFTNAWAICRDPKYWDDPEEFKPERFEKTNLDYKGTCYEYLPFGAGRRICPGINLGVANIELALASLIYHFDWKLPDGMESKDVDVSEASGMSASKKTCLILHPVTHIHPVNA